MYFIIFEMFPLILIISNLVMVFQFFLYSIVGFFISSYPKLESYYITQFLQIHLISFTYEMFAISEEPLGIRLTPHHKPSLSLKF